MRHQAKQPTTETAMAAAFHAALRRQAEERGRPEGLADLFHSPGKAPNGSPQQERSS